MISTNMALCVPHTQCVLLVYYHSKIRDTKSNQT